MLVIDSIGNGCADSTWVDCGSYCCDAGETCGSGTCLSGGSPVPGPTSTRSRSSSRTSSTRTRTSSVPTLDPDTDTFDEDGAIEGITTNKRVALLILVLVVGALVMV
ncbi:hypothetical protein FRC18_012438 [Serendipita sp. 400]|nr:hypothetical protein FRC18_012438 [Serendipita sp. 400]